jgi:hypothetical protein
LPITGCAIDDIGLSWCLNPSARSSSSSLRRPPSRKPRSGWHWCRRGLRMRLMHLSRGGPAVVWSVQTAACHRPAGGWEAFAAPSRLPSQSTPDNPTAKTDDPSNAFSVHVTDAFSGGFRAMCKLSGGIAAPAWTACHCRAEATCRSKPAAAWRVAVTVRSTLRVTIDGPQP